MAPPKLPVPVIWNNPSERFIVPSPVTLPPVTVILAPPVMVPVTVKLPFMVRVVCPVLIVPEQVTLPVTVRGAFKVNVLPELTVKEATVALLFKEISALEITTDEFALGAEPAAQLAAFAQSDELEPVHVQFPEKSQLLLLPESVELVAYIFFPPPEPASE